ncbi:MAG: undecaprenyldiphospho-muramoylpentapeptide beta-N-acetylglucosaminyltransferase [Desulfobacteraceae bacterium]|jgi:UDP-N-acetylglucosamine--N-acetylmuramyl-(pentapeptide) pyrophosphoryl-undecaprenol N-acetylglucosamine transferase
MNNVEQNGKNRDDEKSLKIVMAGGGTGGHLFPGVAIAQEFMARNSQNEIVFVSTGNQLEQRILAKMNFALERVTVEGIKGRGLWNQTKSICKLPRGIYQAIRILRRFQPDLVVGLGSYSAGPVVLAARLMGVKIVLHEQNILPGITNRMLARFADMIFVSFEDTKAHLASTRSKLTGNPVRQAILNRSRQLISEDRFEAGQKPFTILILGGSQGAHRINITMVEALDHLHQTDGLYIFHQTGAADEKMVQDAYGRHNVASTVQSFFDDMAPLYQKADLIICRAGATTVAEITTIGKGVIFIPFPYAADDHQTLNAASLTKKGAAEMILEKDLTAKILGEKIEYYALHPDALCEMARKAEESGNPNAARDIVDCCYRLLGR